MDGVATENLLLALLALSACTPGVDDEENLPVTCAQEAQPFPYPSSGTYVGLHGNRQNNNMVKCTGASTYEQSWQALTQHLVFQPVTLSPDGDAIYAVAARTEGCQLFSLDSSTGETLWCKEGFQLGVSAGSPEVDEDGNIYITSGGIYGDPQGGAVMFSFTRDGVQRWESSLEGFTSVEEPSTNRAPAGLHFTPGGHAATITPDGVLLLLDRTEGSVRAHLDLADATGFSPAPATELEAEIPEFFIQRLESVVGELDEADLELILGASYGGSGAFSDNTIGISSQQQAFMVGAGPDDAHGALLAMDLEESDEPSISLRWTMAFDGTSATSPAISEDGSRLVIGDGASNLIYVDVDACNANTDSDEDPSSCSPAWTWPLLGGQVLGSPSIDEDGTVYAWDTSSDPRDTDLFALATDNSQPQAVWETVFAGEGETNHTWTSAATVLDDIIVGTVTDLESSLDLGLPMPLVGSSSNETVVVDRWTGELLWSHPVSEDSINSPAIGPDGSIYMPLMGMLTLLSLDQDTEYQGGIVRYVPSSQPE